MGVVSMILFNGQNSIIIFCSLMKGLTLQRFISYLCSQKLAFHRENGPFNEELVFFQRWQAMVALVCCVSLEQRLFWKSNRLDINWNQQW